MRLTERVIDDNGVEHIFTKYVKDNGKLKDQKLCDLEDIEERTSIPFSQIVSLKKDDKVYVLYGSQVCEGSVHSINYDELFITILVGETFVDYMLFNQYGKNRKYPMHCWTGAWALTKEELTMEPNYRNDN